MNWNRHLIFMVPLLFFILGLYSCSGESSNIAEGYEQSYAKTVGFQEPSISPGAAQMANYIPKIKGKNVGLVVNQSSMIGNTHLVDTLLEFGINIKSIYAPEHGFRGEADAGEHVMSGNDAKTGIPIISIYGKNRKPSAEQIEDIEVMIFDIQDVGARFYTYISTLHYVMEACAESEIPLIILDRPNPNGFFVDGPILDPKFRSFVGMHEIPVVHGMTIGEYGKMINGEQWLGNGKICDLEVIPCLNYNHRMTYYLPIKPSPNLPNLRSILLYPSICFFEGTQLSIGRGTDKQFQVIGHPSLGDFNFSFTPVSRPGAKNPKLKGEMCKGEDLTKYSVDYLVGNAKLDLKWLLSFYKAFPDKENFFLKNNFFDKLAGSEELRKQIISGKTEEEIRASWEPGLDKFKVIRRKYLIYPE